MTKAILTAIKRLGVLRYFPADSIAQNEIMRALERMVATEEQLTWLVTAVIDASDEWCGLRSLRGLLCTRFRPRDGVEAACGLPGFSPADCEARAALEPATRLLSGTAEAPMSAAELEQFHNELLAPLLGPRKPSGIDRETLRRIEREISQCPPTLSEDEKNRRIREVEESFENRN